MSTQLLDPRTAPDEITDEVAAASATLTPSGVKFDKATRQRLLVAEALADALESMSDDRAWDRLDQAIQSHLLAQARSLQDHVEGLGSQRAVRAVEETALRLKRLERRLEIVIEELQPPKDGRRTQGGMFLGDFTEAEPGTTAAPGDRAKKKAKAPEKKQGAGAAIKGGVHRIRTRAERMASKTLHRRVTAYILAGGVIAAAAVLWNAKESFSEQRHISKPPSAAFKMNEYLKEVQTFLPATSTILRDRDIRIVLSKEWLLRPENRRRQDAEGAHVWLANRNVTGLLLTWDDGTPLARFDGDNAVWFDMTQPGKQLPGSPTSAVSIDR